ncbi:malate dehydrogenase [Engelhardtia mirabilis]|uniref:Malate dehydrogenase n=1 Tax=Engelhardtia mirabilis TaxID=2528011 RepID=A0A518BJK9_9BACT|nr:Malate dehydrogenase [Planctomycetes bacterium Pla133]QDV01496.1 Malate dehydrogenase [Planctomycetes bacterium Pla86]
MQAVTQRKITVVGAGFVGMSCAHRAAQLELASEVVLIDVNGSRARGIALDLSQAAAIEGWGTRVSGTDDPQATADSDLVIVTAGKPRQPGMSRSDLLEVNGRVMIAVAEYVRRLSPAAHVIVVTNPLDTMVHLCRHALGFPARQVTGMAGVLDSARLRYFIAEATGTGVVDVDAMVMGAHGDSMVPLPKRCSVSGVPALDLISPAELDELSDRTRHGGAEIVKLLGTGSAFFAPAAAAVAMAASILNDERRLLPCACLLNGEYGLEGIYMGVPAILGARGVERIVELPLDTEARIAMQKTAGTIEDDLDALRGLGLL